jgi:hypothetical protein
LLVIGRQQDAWIEIVERRIARNGHRQHLVLGPALAGKRDRSEGSHNRHNQDLPPRSHARHS